MLRSGAGVEIERPAAISETERMKMWSGISAGHGKWRRSVDGRGQSRASAESYRAAAGKAADDADLGGGIGARTTGSVCESGASEDRKERVDRSTRGRESICVHEMARRNEGRQACWWKYEMTRNPAFKPAGPQRDAFHQDCGRFGFGQGGNFRIGDDEGPTFTEDITLALFLRSSNRGRVYFMQEWYEWHRECGAELSAVRFAGGNFVVAHFRFTNASFIHITGRVGPPKSGGSCEWRTEQAGAKIRLIISINRYDTVLARGRRRRTGDFVIRRRFTPFLLRGILPGLSAQSSPLGPHPRPKSEIQWTP